MVAATAFFLTFKIAIMQKVNISNNRSLSIQQKAELIPSLQFNGKDIVMTRVDCVW
jgi:hypothetical protein